MRCGIIREGPGNLAISLLAILLVVVPFANVVGSRQHSKRIAHPLPAQRSRYSRIIRALGGKSAHLVARQEAGQTTSRR